MNSVADVIEKDGIILIGSDVIFEKRLVGKIMATKSKNVAAVAAYKNWMTGDVVKCNNGAISEFVDEKDIDYNHPEKSTRRFPFTNSAESYLMISSVYRPFRQTAILKSMYWVLSKNLQRHFRIITSKTSNSTK